MDTPWNKLPLSRLILNQLQELSFNTPTPVQQKAIPPILRGENKVIISPAGSGKTLTYLIPIWVFSKRKGFKAVIIVPSRELSYQISKMIQNLIKGSRENIRLMTGGKSKTSQKGDRSTQITIATPGRLIEHLSKNPSFLKDTQLLVLDEYDKLLALGFEEQLSSILSYLNPKAQRVGFSATHIESQFANEIFKDPGILTFEEDHPNSPILEKIYYLKSPKTKNKLCLEALNNQSGQVIIFVKNTAKANHLKGYLNLHNIPCETLHGKLLQKMRNKIYQKFMDKKIPILVATDLASRGLDTLKVDTVINFDLPQNAEIYIHRKGRAGRLKQTSYVYNYASPEDYLPLKKIEQGLNGPLPVGDNFNNREAWWKSAHQMHKQKVQKEKRLHEIKVKQGLER